MNELKVEQHPDKTSIGRIAKGFDFLGYCLTPAGLVPAARTLQNCLQRIARLTSQGADVNRIGLYLRNWLVWLGGALTGCVSVVSVLRTCKSRGRMVLTLTVWPPNRTLIFLMPADRRRFFLIR